MSQSMDLMQQIESAAAQNNVGELLHYSEIWLAAHPGDCRVTLYTGLASLESVEVTEGRDTIAALLKSCDATHLDHNPIRVVAHYALAIDALRNKDTKMALEHADTIINICKNSDNSHMLNFGVGVALSKAKLHESKNEDINRITALEQAIIFGELSGLRQAVERAALAALLLGYAETNNIQKMRAFRKCIDLSMKIRTKSISEIANFAVAGMIPLGFSVLRDPKSNNFESSSADAAHDSRDAKWFAVTFKMNETLYFLSQLESHVMYPKLMFYFLSAFLSSARSVTFHIQYVVNNMPSHSMAPEKYVQLRTEVLSDDIAKYFVERRNVSEKAGYPPVEFSLRKRHRNPQSGQDVWTELAHRGPMHVTARDLDYVESSLLQGAGPLFPGGGVPISVDPVWTWPDFPGKSKRVPEACQEYADRLLFFVSRLRELVELS